MNTYIVNLWSGVGYSLHREKVEAADEEAALEKAVAAVMAKGLNALWLDWEEAEELARTSGCDIEELEDKGCLFYIDATTEGAGFPCFVRAENLEIYKC